MSQHVTCFNFCTLGHSNQVAEEPPLGKVAMKKQELAVAEGVGGATHPTPAEDEGEHERSEERSLSDLPDTDFFDM